MSQSISTWFAFAERIFADSVDNADRRWQLPTPCERWTVGDIVDHEIVEHEWTPRLLAGETCAQITIELDRETDSIDRVSQLRAAGRNAQNAVAGEQALARSVNLSYGNESAERYIGQRIVDLTVHAWDLSRALGMDDEINSNLVKRCLDGWAQEMQRIARRNHPDWFGEPVEPVAGADDQTRLLALLGRDVAWIPPS